jgi:chromosome segregation ATPase
MAGNGPPPGDAAAAHEEPGEGAPTGGHAPPDERVLLDPTASPVDLLKQRHHLEIARLVDDFHVRESALTRDIQVLEDRALAAEQELGDIRLEMQSLRSELTAAKQSSRQFQAELAQAQYRYESLQRRLCAAFDCSALDNLVKSAGDYRLQKARIEGLERALLEAQLRLGAENIRKSHTIAESAAESLEAHVDTQREQIAALQAAALRQSEECDAQRIVVDRLREDVARAEAANKALEAEIFELKAKAPTKRLQTATHVAMRLDPVALDLDRTSPWFPLFGALARLLRAVGDRAVETEALAQCLVDVSNEAAAVRQTTEEVNGEIDGLTRELEELRSDDKAPEVFALRMKIKEQSDEITALKRRIEEPDSPRRSPRKFS